MSTKIFMDKLLKGSLLTPPSLRSLTKLTCGFTPLVVARLRSVLSDTQLAGLRIPLHQLTLGWEESLQVGRRGKSNINKFALL